MNELLDALSQTLLERKMVKSERWYENTNERERACDQLNQYITEAVLRHEDHIYQLVSKDRRAAVLESLKQGKGHQWIGQKTLMRWYDPEGNQPSPLKISTILVFINPRRRAYDLKDIEGKQSELAEAEAGGSIPISGIYALYNLEMGQKRSRNSIQISYILINEDGTAQLRFKETRNSEILQEEVSLSYQPDRNTLVISLTVPPLAIFMRVSSKPGSILQGSYVSVQGEGMSFSGLMLMVRQSDSGLFFDELEPLRDKRLDDNRYIQHYLVNVGPNLLHQDSVNSYRDLQVALDKIRGPRYQKIASLEGTWYAYRHLQEKDDFEVDYRVWVNRYLLRVEKEASSGNLTCSLEAANGEWYSGKILYQEFKNPDYLICRLINKKQSHHITLTFYIEDTSGYSFYPGIYNATYPGQERLETGICMLVRAEGSAFARMIDPDEMEPFSPVERGIVNYLARGDRARLTPVLMSEQLANTDWFDNCKYTGNYAVYSYGRMEDIQKRCINVSELRISRSGRVSFSRDLKGGEQIVASGWLVKLGDRNVMVKLTDDYTKRVGVLYVYVGVNPPSMEQETFYVGVFSGLGRMRDEPVASRVILEYLADEAPAKAKYILHTREADENLPEPAIRLLSGYLPNFLTFAKENQVYSRTTLKKEADLAGDFGKAFMGSALTYALEDVPDLALRMLKLSIQHGFKNLDDFEDKLQMLVRKNLASKETLQQIKGSGEYQRLVDWLNGG